MLNAPDEYLDVRDTVRGVCAGFLSSTFVTLTSNAALPGTSALWPMWAGRLHLFHQNSADPGSI
jgi:hypothetical protein